MVQRKKEAVREKIIAAAETLFAQKGYVATTMPAIARLAGMSSAGLYTYFPSKLELLFEVHAPWLEDRTDKIERSLRRISDPRLRVRKLLSMLWYDLPRDRNGFLHNIVAAVSSQGETNAYNPKLLDYLVRRVAGWLEDATNLDEEDCRRTAVVLCMALDGFSANAKRRNGAKCDPAMADLFADLLVGGRPDQSRKTTVLLPLISTRCSR